MAISHLLPRSPSPAAAASRTRVMDENDTLVEEPEPFNMPGLPTLQVERRTKVGNLTIDWIKGSLWLAGIDGQWFSNPFHWWSKIGAIYDVQRQNFSSVHPSDGYVQPLAADDIGRVPSIAAAPATKNRAQWKVGSQLPYPPMDVVAFTGDGATVLDSVSSLNDWFASVLDLAIPKTSKYYFNDLVRLRLGCFRVHGFCKSSQPPPPPHCRFPSSGATTCSAHAQAPSPAAKTSSSRVAWMRACGVSTRT